MNQKKSKPLFPVRTGTISFLLPSAYDKNFIYWSAR